METTFQRNLAAYADVILTAGVNLQPGQRLLIGVPYKDSQAPLEAAPLVRLLAAKAYQIGARHVDVLWRDDRLAQARLQHAPRDSFDEFPSWQVQLTTDCINRGDAILIVFGHDPDLLSGQDPRLVQMLDRVTAAKTSPILQLIFSAASNWSLFAVPVANWSAKVFPAVSSEQQDARLWDAIFDLCRANRPDPVAAWQDHLNDMIARCGYLTAKQYSALHYTGPGTNLTVGLFPDHRWGTARFMTKSGIPFTCNIPTEEIGALPDKDRVDGYVTATKPLLVGGALIDGLSVTFSAGRAVKITAKRGEEYLRHLLDTDEGASRIGEVALVPNSSPVSRSGVLFYNILLDENAACHLAFGRCVGTRGNQSAIHQDFMVGSAAIDIDGLTAGGDAQPVMRAGEWAFTS